MQNLYMTYSSRGIKRSYVRAWTIAVYPWVYKQ